MNLSKAELSWVDTVTLDAGEMTVDVVLDVPVGKDAGTATYEETIDFDEPTTPPALHRAATAFVEAVVDFVKNRDAAKGEVKCATCTGACCGRVYNEVHLTHKDVDALDPGTYTLYPTKKFDGYVGVLNRVRWKGAGDASWDGDDHPMACVYLNPKTSLCTIYDRRPSVCRTFTAYDCDDHEEAPLRLIKLRRKELAPPSSS